MEAPGLAEFNEFTFAHDGIKHRVFRAGRGPAVVLMHELPGLTEGCIGLARHLAEEFTVYMPLLFGEPGNDAPLRFFAKLCISREFRLFAEGGGSPIVEWLRALCRRAHAEAGGAGVGAIGMCLTGNFAIALMADESVMAPVAAEPSLPLGLFGAGDGAIAVEENDLRRAAARAAAEGVRLLGLRFTGDRLCPAVRFETLRRIFGEAFEAIEIDSSSGNPHGLRRAAHSVLTKDFVDRDGHPTRDARDRVVAFLHQHLRSGA